MRALLLEFGDTKAWSPVGWLLYILFIFGLLIVVFHVIGFITSVLLPPPAPPRPPAIPPTLLLRG